MSNFTILEPICFCYLYEDEIDKAELPALLPALEFIAHQNKLVLKKMSDMKIAYRILKKSVKNN